ncbi:hypothetical protein HYG90_04290 [Acinetobacter sp. SwsAc7]|nr:hypothetical protein [Acinetobacter sp. SwsAc7]
MTLKIVNHDGNHEVHSVRLDDGVVSVVEIQSGESVSVADMEELFPGFKTIVGVAESTGELLDALYQTNHDYQWAHVSGKL